MPEEFGRYALYFIIPKSNFFAESISDYLFFSPNVSILHLIFGSIIGKIGTFDAAFLMNRFLGFLFVPLIFLVMYKLTDSVKIGVLSSLILAFDPLFNYISQGIEYNLGSLFFLFLMIFFSVDYLKSKKKTGFGLILVSFSLILAQAGRPEFQIITPMIFLLIFLLYEKNVPDKKMKLIFLVLIFFSSLYSTNIMNHFIKGFDSPVTGIDMTGESSISFIRNSFSIGFENIFGNENIFVRFLSDGTIRKFSFILVIFGIVASMQKKEKRKLWIFALSSSMIFFYFYTFWHMEGPFPTVGKYSPMFMIWILMAESLGLFYILKNSYEKRKNIFVVVFLVSLLIWSHGFYQGFDFLDDYTKDYEKCNTLSSGLKEMELLNKNIKDVDCVFVLQRESIVPGIFGDRGSYEIVMDVDYKTEHFLWMGDCFYIVGDYYCEGFSSSTETEVFSRHREIVDEIKERCDFEVLVEDKIENAPFFVYKFNKNDCR